MLCLEDVTIAMDGGALTVQLAASPGQRIAVVGPSGAGKSTLLDAIAGFRAIKSGRILWNGQNIALDAPDTRPVSILFQDGNLFPHLSVFTNLGLAVRPDGWRPTQEQERHIAEALNRVGLDGFGPRLPGTLSGGQRSRVALARVLLQSRPILLLDEPFAALGPAMKAEMLDLVRDVTDPLGVLVMLVTHDPTDAGRFAQDIVMVADGMVAAPANAQDFLADPPPSYRAYLGSPGHSDGGTSAPKNDRQIT